MELNYQRMILFHFLDISLGRLRQDLVVCFTESSSIELSLSIIRAKFDEYISVLVHLKNRILFLKSFARYFKFKNFLNLITKFLPFKFSIYMSEILFIAIFNLKIVCKLMREKNQSNSFSEVASGFNKSQLRKLYCYL